MKSDTVRDDREIGLLDVAWRAAHPMSSTGVDATRAEGHDHVYG